MATFRKKPVEIQAVQWNGENIREIHDFMAPYKPVYVGGFSNSDDILGIDTGGLMIAQLGDWIIRGVAGEFYPVKPDIFAATYEAVPDA